MLPRTGNARSPEGEYTSRTILVAIANTSRSLLEALQAEFGGGRTFAARHVDAKNYKQGYSLKWYGTEAARILRLVEPHLIIKQRQAELALFFLQLRDRAGYRCKRKPLAALQELNGIAARIKALNGRGARAPYPLFVEMH